MDVENFVQKFHNLDGLSIGEKSKNLFYLLKTIPSDHEAVVDSIIPKTYLERFLRLELLVRLQRYNELVQILKSADEYLPLKLIKSKWFCQKLTTALQDDSSEFVDSILPYTSYLLRRRLLKKLAIYGTSLDTLFDKLYVQFGHDTAVDVLIGCSPTKIGEVLDYQTVQLKPRQQKLLYQKHPKLFKEFITSVDNSVLPYIASQDLEYYLKITQNAYFGSSLGKRSTRKLMTTYKTAVIKSANNYSGILHLKTVVKSLKERDLKRFFFNCFPKYFDHLDYCPPVGFTKVRLELGRRYYTYFSEGIQLLYNKRIFDFPDLISEDELENMYPEDRKLWVPIKRDYLTENDVIKMMLTSESIPLIKDKIFGNSSTSSREQLLELFVACCKTDSDLDALATVCEHVSVRHRNDDKSILRNFLYTIKRTFPLEVLDERHWNPMFKILKIAGSDEEDGYYVYDFHVKHLEYLFRENKLDDERLFHFLKYVRSTNRWRYKVKDRNLRKLLLLKSMELMPELLEKGEKLHYCDFQLIRYILSWNKKHPHEKISWFHDQRLGESYLEALDEVRSSQQSVRELCCSEYILENMICTKEKSFFRDQAISVYFSADFRCYNTRTEFWLLKHEPEVIQTHFDKFLKTVFRHYRPDLALVSCVKKYEHLSFPQQMLDSCNEKLAKDDKIRQVSFVLAVLASADTFLESVATYYPSSDKKNDEDNKKGNGKKWEEAITVVSAFKRTSSTEVLPALMQYCKGDLLRYGLEVLYHRFYHLPGNQLQDCINELSCKEMAVSKHAISLTSMVGTAYEVRNLLQRYIENETNFKMLKHVFAGAIRYFRNNPTDEFWDLVKICMEKLDRNDRESFEIMVIFDRIPEKYLPRYIIHIWDLVKHSADAERFSSRLWSAIPLRIYKRFPFKFLKEVLVKYYLKCWRSELNEFVVSCLTHSSFKNEILDAIFNIMRRLMIAKRKWFSDEKRFRDMISLFILSVIYRIGTAEVYKELFRNLLEHWHDMFTPTEAIKEHLTLSVTLMYFDADRDLDKFGDVIAEFLNNLVSTYGIVIVDSFGFVLSLRLKMLLRCYSEVSYVYLNFCLNLIKKFDNPDLWALVIKLLPTTEPTLYKSKLTLWEIIETLRQVPQDSVKMLVHQYMSDMEVIKILD